jgi:hypothetical protein
VRQAEAKRKGAISRRARAQSSRTIAQFDEHISEKIHPQVKQKAEKASVQDMLIDGVAALLLAREDFTPRTRKQR